MRPVAELLKQSGALHDECDQDQPTWSFASSSARMVAGMSPRTPPPSKLKMVTLLPTRPFDFSLMNPTIATKLSARNRPNSSKQQTDIPYPTSLTSSHKCKQATIDRSTDRSPISCETAELCMFVFVPSIVDGSMPCPSKRLISYCTFGLQ